MDESEPLGQDARSLARMMGFGTGREPLWEAEELGSILQHQLDAPLGPDLGLVDRSLPDRLPQLAAAGGRPLGTFRDLFVDPRPPLELLELTKRFAKRCRSQEDSALPGEIATVLYFLAIAAALTRCGRRISGLDEPALCHGLDWALAQPWLDATAREICQAGLSAVRPVS